MQDDADQGHSDELQRKAEELKRRAFEEEARRLEEEASRRASELTGSRISDDAEVFKEKLNEVEEEKRREEQKMQATEDEVQRVLEVERQKRLEARRREELDLKRRELEEQRRAEELKAQEELARRKSEEERIRRESEEERKRESEKKRSELESLRREQDKLRREVERQERIQSLLQAAETFYASGDYEHAAIEVAKALVNDPSRADILALEQKIKEAQGKATPSKIEEKTVEPAASAPQVRSSSVPVKSAKSNLSRYITYGIFAGLVVLAVIVFLHFKKQIFPTTIKVAVMPWNLASNTTEDNLTANGLAAELSQQFEGAKPFVVIGFSSVYRAMLTWKDQSLVVSRLGSPFVIEGSVSHTGDNFFANLQLVDSAGTILWSRQYVKTASLLSQLPQEAYADVMDVLQNFTEEKMLPHNPPKRPVAGNAYLVYLQGMAQLHDQSKSNVQQVRELFVHASEQDTSFAEARAAAARTILFQREHGWDTSRTSLSSALQFAQEAVVLDTSLGNAYCSLGKVFLEEGDYNNAQVQLEHAIERSPRSSGVQIAWANIYFRTGKYNEVMDAMARAYELNPLDLEVLAVYASMHQLTGTSRQGMAYHEAILSLIPDSTAYLITAVADAMLSDPGLSLSYSPRVAAAFQRSLQADTADYSSLYGLARMLQVTGQAADATGLLLRLQSRLTGYVQTHPNDTHAMLLLAKTLTRLGRFGEATELTKHVLKIDAMNPDARYGIAQVYSLQMYSHKNRAIDEKKKADAIRTLREALARGFRLDELTSADFYNMYEQSEFRSALQAQNLP